MLMLVLSLACEENNPKILYPPKVEQSGVIQCLKPEARLERPFDQYVWEGVINPAATGETFPCGGAGATAGDLNGDGIPDILLAGATDEQLWFGQSATSWEDTTAAVWPAANDLTAGALLVDYDGDRDLDAFLTNLRVSNRLLQNDGGVFTDVSAVAGIQGPGYDSTSASFADFDKDGDLDLFVANHNSEPNLTSAVESGVMPSGDPSELYRNNGDGTFTDISNLLPPELQDNDYPFLGGWIDVDQDGWVDLYIANDFGPQSDPNMYLHNEEGEGFTWVRGNGLDLAMYAMGLGFGDFNGDGLEDIAISDWGRVFLLQADGAGGFYDVSQSIGLQPNRADRVQAWGLELADMDNDGDLDLPVGFGNIVMPPEEEELLGEEFALQNPKNQPDALFLQQEDGTLLDVADSWGLAQTGSSRGFVLADLNQDGFLDLLKRYMDGPPTLHLSRCDDSAWLSVELSQESQNTFAIGAKIILEADGQSWFRILRAGGTNFATGQPPIAHFGLGGLEEVNVRVIWPDGAEEEIGAIQTRQRILITRQVP
jgi:hypothetical protein